MRVVATMASAGNLVAFVLIRVSVCEEASASIALLCALSMIRTF